MMDCERITEYFGAFYEGESDARIEKMVKDHLRSCAACREDYKWYGVTIQAMANLEQIAPPNDFLIQLNARIDKNSSPLKSIISQIKNLLNSIPTAPVPVGAVSLAFVTIMAIYVYNYSPAETSHQSLQTAVASREASSASQGEVPLRPLQSQMVASAPYSRAFAPYTTPGGSAVSWRFPTVADELGADNFTVESPHVDLALQTLKNLLPDIQGTLVDENLKGSRGEALIGVIIPSNRYGDLATALVNHGAVEVGVRSQGTDSPAPSKLDSGNVRLYIRFTQAPK
jgi:hypothetical protein